MITRLGSRWAAVVVCLLGLVGWSPDALAQARKKPVAPAEPYAAVDRRMALVPDSAARTAAGLARYIRASFASEGDRARAAFGWVARNIRYDHENMFVLEYEREPAVVVQETLDKRRGVCRHYAELYCALANQLGIKTYVVPGYASLRDPVGHAWCASRIDGQWYLMDPTWALQQGTINGKPFTSMRNEYYRMKPAAAIESHMPFDPLWQLLRAPRTPQQFQLGQTPPAPARPFAFADSLAAYEQQSPPERLRATNRRIEQNGVTSGLIFQHLLMSRQREESYRVQRYNEAVAHLNAGAERLNGFIEFFNHQFQPRKTDAELEQLLPPVAAELSQARQLLSGATFADANTQELARQLRQSLQEAETKLQNCQAFMARYLRTGKLLRPMMFTNLDANRNEVLR